MSDVCECPACAAQMRAGERRCDACWERKSSADWYRVGADIICGACHDDYVVEMERMARRTLEREVEGE